jgi:penicillin-binding protein 1C
MRAPRLIAAAFSQVALAAVALALSAEIAVRLVEPVSLDRLSSRGTLVHAADGTLLTGFLSSDDKLRFDTSLDDVDPGYRAMLVAYEDSNFASHRGVDLGAVARAAYQSMRHGRVVSGASTISMQLVRLLEPRPRTIAAKLLEMAQAVELERRLSKDDILRAYLTVAPFGSNVEGVRAASLLYLGKEPARLSLAEAALLVAVPQAPEARRPDTRPEPARIGRDRVLSTLAARGELPASDAAIAARRPVDVSPPRLPLHAPHLARRLAASSEGDVTTLIEAGLQSKVEAIAETALRGWGEAVNVAIVVMRNRDGAIVAHVGSAEPGAVSRDGDVDMTRAVRSPGSALKPFIYAMAFEQLLVHPDTIVADQPVDFAGYRPNNADGIFSGDISVRQSLILSKNTVPVMLLDKLRVEAFLARFRSVGQPMRLAASDREAGLAVALGGLGVTLEQMVWLYSAFANEGALKRLRHRSTDRAADHARLFAPAAANAVADILADVPPPAGSARLAARDGTRRVGFKTGTSYGFRDAWSIGFDRGHTVGVWIGRPDGAPHLGAYGVTAAAPIMMEVFDVLPAPASGAGSGRHPLGALASPRELPPRLVRFGPVMAQAQGEPLTILFPRPGSQIAGAGGQLPLRLAGGRPPYRWSVAGVAGEPQDGTRHWAAIAGRGEIAVTVTDAEGRVASTSFWYE